MKAAGETHLEVVSTQSAVRRSGSGGNPLGGGPGSCIRGAAAADLIAYHAEALRRFVDSLRHVAEVERAHVAGRLDALAAEVEAAVAARRPAEAVSQRFAQTLAPLLDPL